MRPHPQQEIQIGRGIAVRRSTPFLADEFVLQQGLDGPPDGVSADGHLLGERRVTGITGLRPAIGVPHERDIDGESVGAEVSRVLIDDDVIALEEIPWTSIAKAHGATSYHGWQGGNQAPA
jgi:hypothetical protein